MSQPTIARYRWLMAPEAEDHLPRKQLDQLTKVHKQVNFDLPAHNYRILFILFDFCFFSWWRHADLRCELPKLEKAVRAHDGAGEALERRSEAKEGNERQTPIPA